MKQFNLEEYLKNPLRKVVTRDGQPVKIYCTDFDDSEYPIIAHVEGTSVSTAFTKDGKYIKFNGDSKYDLFFASEKHEGWVNVYRGDIGITSFSSKLYISREEAEKAGKTNSYYVATAKIEWEE